MKNEVIYRDLKPVERARKRWVVLSLISVILRIFLYLYPFTTARRNATFLSSAEMCRLMVMV